MYCLTDGEAGASSGFLRAADRHAFCIHGYAPYCYKTADGINLELRDKYHLTCESHPGGNPLVTIKSCYNALYIWVGPKSGPRYKLYSLGLNSPLNGRRDIYVLPADVEKGSKALVNLLLFYNPSYLMVTGPTSEKDIDLITFQLCDKAFTTLEKMKTVVRAKDGGIYNFYFRILHGLNDFIDNGCEESNQLLPV